MKNDNNELVKYEEGELNRYEIRQLVNDKVTSSLCMGVSKNKILKNLQEDSYGIGYKYSHAQAINIFYEIRKKMKDEFLEHKEMIMEDLYFKLTNLYSINYKNKNYKEARNCINDIAKMLGINSTGNSITMNQNTGEVTISFGFEQ